MPNCEKYQAVLDYIKQWKSTTHGIDFEAEMPIDQIFEDIIAIIQQSGSQDELERLAVKAARSGDVKDLQKYIQARKKLL